MFGERFEVLSNDVDRRLLVNRKRRVRMQRVWVQAKLRLKADGDLGGNEGEAKEEQTDRKNVENGSDER